MHFAHSLSSDLLVPADHTGHSIGLVSMTTQDIVLDWLV